MPQQIHVVQCYKCQTYQSDIIKKVNKWNCKMCGEKQSLKHVYGIGSGKDCRLIVQKLSAKTMQADFVTSNIVEGILDGTIKIQEESNSKIKTEPDGKSAWIDLLDDFTEKEEGVLPQSSLNTVSSNFYTKPEKDMSSSSDSKKSSWNNLLNNFTEKEEEENQVSSNFYAKPEKKTVSSSCSTKYTPYSKSTENKNLPNLVGYYNKEGSKSTSKELEKLPESSTNNDYWSTDNLNDEELDEILKLDF